MKQVHRSPCGEVSGSVGDIFANEGKQEFGAERLEVRADMKIGTAGDRRIGDGIIEHNDDRAGGRARIVPEGIEQEEAVLPLRRRRNRAG